MDGWYVKSVAVYKAIETDCTFWWSSGISGDCESDVPLARFIRRSLGSTTCVRT